MAPIAADVEARRYLYATITGDPTLAGWVGTRVYTMPAPADAADPFVVLAAQGGKGDLRILNTNARPLWTELLYDVIAVRRGSDVAGTSPTLEQIEQRLLAVLNGTQGTTPTPATIFECVRIRTSHVMPEFNRRTGVEYSMLGSCYRVRVGYPLA